jgi:hypothetical protein
VVSFLRFHGDISVQSLDGKECGAERFHLFWICNSRSNLVVNKKDEIFQVPLVTIRELFYARIKLAAIKHETNFLKLIPLS